MSKITATLKYKIDHSGITFEPGCSGVVSSELTPNSSDNSPVVLDVYLSKNLSTEKISVKIPASDVILSESTDTPNAPVA